MIGKIQIIGTNGTTSFLEKKEDPVAKLEYINGIHVMYFLGKEYLFDLKASSVLDDHMVFWGWLSDRSMAGRICVRFYPKTS